MSLFAVESEVIEDSLHVEGVCIDGDILGDV